MAYTIIKTNGTVLTTIADGTVNTTSTSLELPGRNYPGYGELVDTNFVHLLENFADSSVPDNPIRGQLWYNTTTQMLYVCPTDGETNINNWFSIITQNDLANLSLPVLTISGNIVANNITLTNQASANVVSTNYLQVNLQSNLYGNSTISNITANTITAGVTTGTINGNWTINGNIASSNNITANNLSSVNLVSTGNLIVSNNIKSNLIPNVDTTYNLGNAARRYDNVYASNLIGNLTGNVTATQLSGNGFQLTDLPAANLVGTIALAVQGNITSVGTLGNLAVTGNITSGNVYANSGRIGANLLTGTLTTASQPNITSLGNLTGLTSNGQINFINSSNVSLGNVANLKILGGNINEVLVANGAGGMSFASLSSLTIGAGGTNTQVQFNNNGTLGASANFVFNSSNNTLIVSGNVNATSANLGNSVSANFFVGSGYNLSNIQGSNILGQAPNSIVAGTVYTNAQPNITSVGTLTNLSVTGNITSSANVTAITLNGNVTVPANGNIVMSGAQSLLSGANRVSANFLTGTITTATQPNITSVGTLLSLSVVGNINSGSANIGNVVTASYFVGNGYGLTNLNGANISNLTVGNAAFASVAGTVAGANVTGQVNFANVANRVAGANVIGTVANAVYSNVSAQTNFVAGINVFGAVSNANYANTAGSANVSNSANSVAGSNVSGAVANATYANIAGVAYSVAGSNVSGAVANATYANIAGVAYSVAGANVSGAVANATFSTNGIPSGGIIMWSGSIASIPAGWYLCDGTNGTPNLRDRFVLGAGNIYLPSATGGSANAIVVSHTHTASVIDPGHDHSYYRSNINISTTPGGAFQVVNTGERLNNTSSKTTGISVTNDTTGSSGVGANMPPYYALAFIMKA